MKTMVIFVQKTGTAQIQPRLGRAPLSQLNGMAALVILPRTFINLIF